MQAPPGSIFDHVEDLIRLFGPIVAVVVGLLTWAWRRLEKDNEANLKALETHVADDQRVHDLVFTQLRTEEERRNQLAQAHAELQGRFEALITEHEREMDRRGS